MEAIKLELLNIVISMNKKRKQKLAPFSINVINLLIKCFKTSSALILKHISYTFAV